MEDTVLKVALAGLLHDIGKVAQEGMDVHPDFINRHRGLYQPYYNNNYSHEHVIYTAAFIDKLEKILPKELNRPDWGLGDPFINIAAGHHNPETPLQWIVTTADRLSSGWDRKGYEEYNKTISPAAYRRTRLITTFERLLRGEGKNFKSYRYPLKELHPTGIFPHKEGGEIIDEEKAREEYKKLFDGFVESLEKLSHIESISLWYEHLESLMAIYLSQVPSARAGNVFPDVSLYDHSRIVAAIAAALYCYHADNKTLNVEEIKNNELDKFLLVGGDFYGIQKFIFSEGLGAEKNRAKILRGRSLAVSLYTELAADLILRDLGLPCTSLVFNAGGKWILIASNTEKALEVIKEKEKQINEWLFDVSLGESAFGITYITAAAQDFEAGRFKNTWDKIAEKWAEKKFKKLDLDKFGGEIKDFLDKFQNDLEPPVCAFCGKRPSDREASQKRKEEGRAICRICHDHLFLGENIVKKEKLAITSPDADIKGEKLLVPIFDSYQVSFTSGELNALAKGGKLYRYWTIALDESGNLAKDITVRPLAGYVPVYRQEDFYDDRILWTRKSEAKKEQMIVEMDEGKIKTFEHIAVKSLFMKKENEKVMPVGIPALGILKADVDHLGKLMSLGLKREEYTVSRLAALSRQMNQFFTVYLPYLFMTDQRFQDIYTLFAGGDDLFLIGPWNRITELSVVIRDKFTEYTCHNEEIHLSAGIAVQKPNTPIDRIAEIAESALKQAKKNNRNSITVFGETVKWDDFKKMREFTEKLSSWFESGFINNAMIYRLNTFIDQAEREQEVLERKEIYREDMHCLKWRAFFRYITERNVGKNLKDKEKRQAKDEFSQVVKWIEAYKGKLRIPLWEMIYNNRRGGR